MGVPPKTTSPGPLKVCAAIEDTVALWLRVSFTLESVSPLRTVKERHGTTVRSLPKVTLSRVPAGDV